MKLNKTINLIFLACLILPATSNAASSNRWAESYKNEAMGEYEKAAEIIEPIIENQKSEFARLRHGWLNYLQGKYSESVKDYKAALEMNDKSIDAMLGVTLPLLAQKRWREAADYSTRILSVAPWNYYAHVRLMICEEGLQQWKILELHAADASKRYPADATILVYLARAKARMGKVAEAKDIYRNVLERIPSHLEATQFLGKN